jgi:hypothetical protein
MEGREAHKRFRSVLNRVLADMPEKALSTERA